MLSLSETYLMAKTDHLGEFLLLKSILTLGYCEQKGGEPGCFTKFGAGPSSLSLHLAVKSR